ncbi:MAG: hypothetical protein QOF78_4374 [Phycisphaerales bacterium]|jgi:hypothetical protein|nr:hypothetical protein [Phycisphaerales bacterium]
MRYISLASIAAAAVAFTFAISLGGTRALAAPTLPDFAPINFAPGAPIDNPYFPLVPGTRFRYAANVTDPENGETVFEEDEDFVTTETRTIAGVQVRVVHARSWEDGELAEDTLDYFAQDKSGNVWYLGEDTKAFERDDEGNIISADTTGSWRAGVNDAKPGFVMPADTTIGFNYYQEFAPNDEALDQATILSTSETVSTPAGDFSDVLKTREETEIEPDVLEFKYYAPGVGLVLVEENVDDAGVPQTRIPLISVANVGTAIPLPAAFGPGLAGLAFVLGAAMTPWRRHRAC